MTNALSNNAGHLQLHNKKPVIETGFFIVRL